MKLSSKVKLLNSLGLFNIARDFYYRLSPQVKTQMAFYKNFIKKDDLCFDIGANIGQKVDIFLKLEAKIIAVEPQPECAKYLRNKYAHKKNQVTIEQIALDQTPGQKTIHINEANALSTMSQEWINKTRQNQRFNGLEWKQTEKVKTDTLDNLIHKYGTPKFCKIDVEGFELNVIKGLTQPIQYLSLECTPENLNNLFEVMEHLNTLGAIEFQFCTWDHYILTNDWHNKDTIIENLKSQAPENLTGDIYARFK